MLIDKWSSASNALRTAKKVTIMLPDEYARKLTLLAASRGMTRSATIRSLIKEAFER